MLLQTKALKWTVGATVGTAVAFGAAGTAFGSTTLNETGSSLVYPLVSLWIPAYTKIHPNVKINAASTGSGTGISQSTKGIVDMGGSDAYLSNAQMKKHPNMLNIPVAISSQMIDYNIPGLNNDHLKLSAPILSKIYRGKIKYWDNSKIQSMNSGVNLPHKEIVTLHRADGSGDTFLFTQFLSKATQNWRKDVGLGTTVSWPNVSGAIGATGNTGMVTAMANNPYSVAYIGISYKGQIKKKGLGEAMVKNKAGNFVLPTKKTVPAAAAQMVPKTPASERISLIYAPGKNSYPIINYEYLLVQSHQHSQKKAKQLKQFLKWAVSPQGGNQMKFLKQVQFMPLPSSARKLTIKQINKIHS